MLEDNYINIPEELTSLNQWVVWGVDKDNLKCPYKPVVMKKAKFGDPSTWGSYSEAVDMVKINEAKGVGFQFYDNGIYGINLAGVIINGKLTSEAREIIKILDSYTEVNFSRTGLNIFVKAKGINLEANRKSFIGIYCKDRYFPVTGNLLDSSLNIVQERTNELNLVYNKWLKPRVSPNKLQNKQIKAISINNNQEDDLYFLKLGLNKDALFAKLWNGERPNMNESSDDQALFNKLAYWCNKNEYLMEESFFESPYYNQKGSYHKDKCNNNEYIQRNIRVALNNINLTARENNQQYQQKEDAIEEIEEALEIEKVEENITIINKSNESSFSFINPFSTSTTRRRYTWDDMGFGFLFADTYKDIIRYIPEIGCWFHFNGKVWIQDLDSIRTIQLSKELIRYLNKFAYEIDDEEIRELYLEILNNRRNKICRDQMIDDAKSEYPISINRFDKDIYTFNCQNGTINLDVMEFRPHDSEDYLCKISNVKYDSYAKCKQWDQFIIDVFDNNTELIRFLQKSIGYCMAGNVSEEYLFIFHSNNPNTNNQITTILKSIAFIFGDYAKEIPLDVLLENIKFSNNNLMLKGTRFIGILESKTRFVPNMIQNNRQNDFCSTKNTYNNSFDYNLEYKLIVNANSLSNLEDKSIFINDKILVIPFNNEIESYENIKNLSSHFTEPINASAILNWCINGYKMFKNEGLIPPNSVLEATQQYKKML